ncbi:ATP synthase subunit I [Marinomonas posidonica]|uniref:ATP synthase I chain n=1 Tax=Marinomonas posidonica (strain CECT 7376 / NCIMB 14433 / IVIA-Po-181) TaxID=491952 RepID=F6CVS5_MARPP|nr:ATP synthase subunit I [Marinomonas posidonica]AEF56549.1 ATP synthase I chain [Marinomonas posidonica IVIA-Po-181]
MGNQKPRRASEILSAKKKAVLRFLLLQVFLSIFTALGIFFIAGGLYGYSFILGALSSIIPSMFMAWRMFGKKGTQPAKEMVRTFYRGEASKLAMTVCLLSLVFLLIKPLSAGAFFAGFGIAILSHWLSPILLRNA